MRHRTQRQLVTWRRLHRTVYELEDSWLDRPESLVTAVVTAADFYSSISPGVRAYTRECPPWPAHWGPPPPWIRPSQNAASAHCTSLKQALATCLLELRTAMPTITRQRRHWAAYRISLLPKSSFLPITTPIHLATRDRSGTPDLDAGLVLFPTGTSVLARQTTKALLALQSISVSDLSAAFNDDARLSSLSPKDIQCILTLHRSFRVNNSQITLVPNLLPLASLTKAERAALQILTETDGVVDREYYLYRMATAGFTTSLASTVIRSPCFLRLERGIYGLRGRSVRPAVINAARNASMNRFRRGLVRFQDGAQSAALHYCLSIRSVNTGRLPLPAALQLDVGNWTAVFPDETVGVLQVRTTVISGLRPWLRREHAGVRSRLSLEVNKDSRMIYVTAFSI